MDSPLSPHPTAATAAAAPQPVPLLHPLCDGARPSPTESQVPTSFNDPFCYAVHPLCRRAADAVADYICRHDQLGRVLAEGKMLGVLVARDAAGHVGFLAAYSGRLNTAGAGQADDSLTATAARFFVPPIYDARQPGGRFVRGEAALASMSDRIEAMEHSAADDELRHRVASLKEQAREAIAAWQEQMARSKSRRDQLRSQGHPLGPLIAESQYQKAELHRRREQWRERIAEAEAPLSAHEQELQTLRQRRRSYSDALQRWLFDQYVLMNAAGERMPLARVAALRTSPLLPRLKPDSPQLPPAATGDCCAPKLLQYAYSHGLQPLQIAEFWWKPDSTATRQSSQAETRHHLAFYPACHSRCLLILPWMMRGLPMQQPAQAVNGFEFVVKIVYEDDHLAVVDKPAGLLSVPNDTGEPSLVTIMNGCKHPDNTLHDHPYYPVHRLDQDTSGLLLMVKDSALVPRMQHAFEHREVEKEYVAVVEGRPPMSATGKRPAAHEPQEAAATASTWQRIELPLRPDIDDRPRQMVDHAGGKPSVTLWQIDNTRPDATPTADQPVTTRLLLRPLTGRTHQLRVHCAHPEGLGCPIAGDRLYGRDSSAGLMAGTRLLLHACRLSFTHPVTGQRLTVCSPPPF